MATTEPYFIWPATETPPTPHYFYQKHPRFRIKAGSDNRHYSFSLSGDDSSGNSFFHWLPSGTQWNQCSPNQVIDI